MKPTIHFIIPFIQSCLAFATGVLLYIILNAFGFAEGTDTSFMHLFVSALLSFVSLITCFIISLPIRFIPSLREWWMAHPTIPPRLILIGFLIVVVSVLPIFQQAHTYDEGGTLVPYTAPHMTLATIGWVITVFGVLHNPPPIFFTRWMDQLSNKSNTKR